MVMMTIVATDGKSREMVCLSARWGSESLPPCHQWFVYPHGDGGGDSPPPFHQKRRIKLLPRKGVVFHHPIVKLDDDEQSMFNIGRSMMVDTLDNPASQR